MSKRIHMALDIAGAIRAGKFGYFTDENGHRIRPEVARGSLRLKLAKGEKLMPLCDPKECPDFSPETGCPGHEYESETDVVTP